MPPFLCIKEVKAPVIGGLFRSSSISTLFDVCSGDPVTDIVSFSQFSSELSLLIELLFLSSSSLSLIVVIPSTGFIMFVVGDCLGLVTLLFKIDVDMVDELTGDNIESVGQTK